MVASALLLCGLQFQALSLCVAHQDHAQCSSCLAGSEHLLFPVNYDSTNDYGSCGAFKKHICSNLESLWDSCSCDGFCKPELEDYYQCSTAALTSGKMDCDEDDLPCFSMTHGMRGKNNENEEKQESFSSVSQRQRQLFLQGPITSIFNFFVWLFSSIFNSFVWFLNLFDIFNIIPDPPKRPLVAKNDVAFTEVNTSIEINVLANDDDPDGDAGDALRVSAIVKRPSNGTAVIKGDGTDGIITYTPDFGFSGIDIFKYEMTSDGGCPQGFRGASCDVDIDECTENPSICNNGACTNTPGLYRCTCDPGWGGANCNEQCNGINFVLDLTLDDFPEETTWQINNAEGRVVTGGPYGPSGTTVRTAECIEGEGPFIFIINDKVGNGICCSNGEGEYKITFGGVDFTPTDGFTDGFEQVVPLYSCAGNFFVLSLTFDDFPGETSWEIIDSNGKNVTQKGPYGDLPEQTERKVEAGCITVSQGEGLFTFIIYDTGGNGICCSNGEGDYKITFGGVDFTPADGFTDGFEQVVPLYSRRKASVQVNATPHPTALPPKHKRRLQESRTKIGRVLTQTGPGCTIEAKALEDNFYRYCCDDTCTDSAYDQLAKEQVNDNTVTCPVAEKSTCSKMDTYWETKCISCGNVCYADFEKYYKCLVMDRTNERPNGGCGSGFTCGETDRWPSSNQNRNNADQVCVCFSPSNTVEVKDKGAISITELQIGDLVSINEKGEYSRVYSFSHRDDKSWANYLQVFAEGLPQPLEISSNHLLFVNTKLTPAFKVKEGDILNSNGSRNKVSKITSIQRKGIYSPLTESGTIRVSGADASNYVSASSIVPHTIVHLLDLVPYSFHHMVSHEWTAPHRWVCSLNFDICKEETYTNGYSSWVYYANVQFLSKLGKAPKLLQIGFALLVAPLLVGLHSPLLVVTFVVFSMYWYKKSAMNKTKMKVC